MTEVQLLEYKIKQLVEDSKAAWATVRATEKARVEAEKERDELKLIIKRMNNEAV